MTIDNRRLVLTERPTGRIDDSHFTLETVQLAEPADGDVRVRVLWCSFDPAQRGWLNDIPSYVPPVAIGEVMRAYAVGQVEMSTVDTLPEGTTVEGMFGWQDHWQGPAADVAPLPDDQHPERYLGVLGTTGLTAYFGMTDIGRPTPGDTVLVTSAGGATGSVAGQIARIAGAERVIGTAGSPEKRAWLTDVAGFSDAIDHYADRVGRALRAAAPEGFDVVFDNVGGTLLDSALSNIAIHARIALCGAISTGYLPERPEVGLRNYQLLTTRRSRMEGFLLSDYQDRFPHARAELSGWLDSGLLTVEESVVDGLEHAPAGLQRLFDGGNLGKLLLRVAS